MRFERRNPSRVGVEGCVQCAHESGAQRRSIQFARHVVLPLAVRAVRVRHITRRLLEVGHQAAPLEHFRQHVRHALAGEVGAAQLRDRIVAVLVQHLCVELVGAGGAGAFERDGLWAVPYRRWCMAGGDVAKKLIQEQPAKRLGRSRIAGKQRAFDGLRQIDEREDRPVGVGEVRREGPNLFGCERVGCEGSGHAGSVILRDGDGAV